MTPACLKTLNNFLPSGSETVKHVTQAGNAVRSPLTIKTLTHRRRRVRV